MSRFCAFQVDGGRIQGSGAALEPTAEQQLLASVREGQVLDGRDAASHGPAQVSCVTERPHRQAVQVNWLYQVRQQRPLEAQHGPPGQKNTFSNSEGAQRNGVRSTRDKVP